MGALSQSFPVVPGVTGRCVVLRFLLRGAATATQRERNAMGIQEVADLLGVSKKKIWKAVKDEELRAVKVRKGNAWRYLIEPEDIEAYRQVMDDSKGWEVVSQDDGTVSETAPHQAQTEDNAGKWQRNTFETHEKPTGPPVELYIEMLDRLQRAERRAIELEMQLRQSQRLLTEHAESVVEREARAQEAEAKEAAQRVEVERLAHELTRVQEDRARPKPSGWFSWLGLRRHHEGAEKKQTA